MIALAVLPEMRDRKLPKYRNPPVTEVLCAVYFQDLVRLDAPHLGAFWQTIRSEYPKTQTMPPLPPISAPAAPFTIQFGMLENGELPRTWFIKNDGTSLIQV